MNLNEPLRSIEHTKEEFEDVLTEIDACERFLPSRTSETTIKNVSSGTTFCR